MGGMQVGSGDISKTESTGCSVLPSSGMMGGKREELATIQELDTRCWVLGSVSAFEQDFSQQRPYWEYRKPVHREREIMSSISAR